MIKDQTKRRLNRALCFQFEANVCICVRLFECSVCLIIFSSTFCENDEISAMDLR